MSRTAKDGGDDEIVAPNRRAAASTCTRGVHCMRQVALAAISCFLLLTVPTTAQTTAPTTPAPAPGTPPAPAVGAAVADWWWIIAIVLLAAVAIWYFMRMRARP